MKEAIERFTPEVIKRHIRLKAVSLGHFIFLVAREGETFVKAEPVVKAKNRSKSQTVGYIGDFEYSTRYTSQTRTGRKIMFNEVHERRFGSEGGIGDLNERNLYHLRSLITADSRLDEIKERLPHVEIQRPSEILDEERRESYWSEARRLNIAPFPKQENTKKP